ncbi:MAG: RIP metalloprotease RseP [Rhizobiales bacterium]|nr:RIP metalloprotease RseP [Hyphomicrobiales bacterium]
MELSSLVNLPLGYILPFLVAITIIVFVHEYGHFQVARWCGVKVEAFSIGFGREIFGWFDKHGTRWKICWLPLGGYVRFEGDANAASMPGEVNPEAVRGPGNFHSKPIWQRALIVAAGPFANFILSIFIFTAAYSVIGVPYAEPRVDEVIAGSAAEQAGLKPGDFIRKVDGKETRSFSSVQEIVWQKGGVPLAIVVERAGAEIDLTLTPRAQEVPDGFGGTIKVGLLGVKHDPKTDQPLFEHYSVPEAFVKGIERTWYIIATTGHYVGKLFTGNESINQIGGPIAMAKGAGDTASSGGLAFISFVALLSVSIGLINLFPVPMLDGGHLVFYAVEALRGKPLGPNAQEWGYRIGFSFVVMLMLIGIWNDVVRTISVVLGS